MASANAWVGQSIKRKEDRRLLVGDGQYLPDIVLPRMVVMGLVRSIYAHAKITAIDTTQATALPGVANRAHRRGCQTPGAGAVGHEYAESARRDQTAALLAAVD